MPQKPKSLNRKKKKESFPNLPADVASPDKPPFTPVIRKKSPAKTVWIDVAALRRSLKEQENSALKILAAAEKKKAVKKENDALLNMGGAKQLASLKNEISSDTELNASDKSQKTPENKTTEAENTPPLKAVGKKEDENVKKAVRSKVAQAQKKPTTALFKRKAYGKSPLQTEHRKTSWPSKSPKRKMKKSSPLKIWLEKKPITKNRQKNISR